MTKHTPLPWSKAQAQREWSVEANFGAGSYSSVEICAKGRKDPVCIVVQVDPNGYRSGDAELDANVAFIVRAVNAHEDLVAALSLAVARLSKLEPGDSRAVSDEFVALAAVSCGLATDQTRSVIRDALTKAEGK